MFRFFFETLFIVLIVVIARAVLTAVMKGITSASRGSSQNQPADSARQRSADASAQPTGELHKDPVCGTYVAESTPFRRQIAGQTFYYCSDACREKHALVAR